MEDKDNVKNKKGAVSSGSAGVEIKKSKYRSVVKETLILLFLIVVAYVLTTTGISILSEEAIKDKEDARYAEEQLYPEDITNPNNGSTLLVTTDDDEIDLSDDGERIDVEDKAIPIKGIDNQENVFTPSEEISSIMKNKININNTDAGDSVVVDNTDDKFVVVNESADVQKTVENKYGLNPAGKPYYIDAQTEKDYGKFAIQFMSLRSLDDAVENAKKLYDCYPRCLRNQGFYSW